MVKSNIKTKVKTKRSIFTMMRNFFKTYHKRIFTSIILLVFVTIWMFIGSIYLEPIFGYKPQWSAYTFMTINSIIFTACLYEIINLRKLAKWSWSLKIFIISTGLLLLWFPIGQEMFGPYLYNKFWFETWMTLLLILFLVSVFLLITVKVKNFAITDVIFIFTWVFYLTFAFKATNYLMLGELHMQKFGWPTILFLLVIVMANDIGAFLGGICYGKKPLAPRISPHKTWEGAITGLVTALILSMILPIVFLQCSNYNPFPFHDANINKAVIYIAYFATTFILSVVSQMGDLLFSYVKRNYGIKDFANILPGHGGLLDRLDSFSAVVIFAFMIILAANN